MECFATKADGFTGKMDKYLKQRKTPNYKVTELWEFSKDSKIAKCLYRHAWHRALLCGLIVATQWVLTSANSERDGKRQQNYCGCKVHLHLKQLMIDFIHKSP